MERNDYTEADTFKATIDYKSFPFDPRCIRACGISIHMENRKKVYDESNIIDPIITTKDNVIFQGFADESGINFDDSTRTIELEGRDFTGLFVDSKRLNTSPIALAKPIDQVIKDLINEQEATKDIEIDNRTGEVMPILAKLAPDFNEVTSVKNQKRKETYWEIMQDIVSRVGFIGFIEVDKFVISKPQNIYEKKNIKQFIYGGNIKDLNFKRRLGRQKDFNVKIRSFNPLTKQVIEAIAPEMAISERFIQNFGNKRISIPQLDKNGKKIEPPKDAEMLTFIAKDISNVEQLIKIAESVFEEMSRQQIEGKLTTYEMEIPQESEKAVAPISFAQIRNGTAIRVYLSQDELSAVSSTSDKSKKIAFLVRRGYPKEIASAFADSLNRINTAFYTKSVSFSLDQEDGFTMEIEFINFIDLDSSLLGY